MKSAAATVAVTSELWASVSAAHPVRHRNRAGLRFEKGVWRHVRIVDDAEAAVEERRGRGASVVTSRGAAALLADPALECRDTKPADPVPLQPPPMLEVALSSVLRALAALLGVVVPDRHDLAVAILRTVVQRRAREPGDRILAQLWQRVDTLLEREDEGAELQLLLFALGAELAPPRPLPPVQVQRWQWNEEAPRWLHTLADLVGVGLIPQPWHGFDPMGLVELENEIASRASNINPSSPGLRPHATVDELVARRDAAIAEQRRALGVRSEMVDSARRRVLAAIDAAAATHPPPLVWFALDYIGRVGRGLPATAAIDADTALVTICGAVALSAPPADEAPRPTVRICVRTVGGIKGRSRGGFRFSGSPVEIDCTPEVEAAIRADEGLRVIKLRDVGAEAADERFRRAAMRVAALEHELGIESPEPRVGDVTVRMIVSTANEGIKHRRRAGFTFQVAPTPVTCTPAQAAEIRSDDGLVVIEENDAGAEDRARIVEARQAELEAELEKRKAASEGRRAAPDPNDGTPARLKAGAAAAARAKAEKAGGKP